jgi:N-acetylmuramoyl-L-alanine amidase
MALADKKHIVIHHSLTADSGTVSWGAIRKYHIETNKFREIGYHFGVELIGNTYEVLLGRMVHEDAAAVKESQMNRKGVHICMVGNFDKDTPPALQWRKCVDLVASLCLTLNLKPSDVSGHRDWAKINGQTYKSCPGWRFDMDAFRRDVAAKMGTIR